MMTEDVQDSKSAKNQDVFTKVAARLQSRRALYGNVDVEATSTTSYNTFPQLRIATQHLENIERDFRDLQTHLETQRISWESSESEQEAKLLELKNNVLKLREMKIEAEKGAEQERRRGEAVQVAGTLGLLTQQAALTQAAQQVKAQAVQEARRHLAPQLELSSQKADTAEVAAYLARENAAQAVEERRDAVERAESHRADLEVQVARVSEARGQLEQRLARVQQQGRVLRELTAIQSQQMSSQHGAEDDDKDSDCQSDINYQQDAQSDDHDQVPSSDLPGEALPLFSDTDMAEDPSADLPVKVESPLKLGDIYQARKRAHAVEDADPFSHLGKLNLVKGQCFMPASRNPAHSGLNPSAPSHSDLALIGAEEMRRHLLIDHISDTESSSDEEPLPQNQSESPFGEESPENRGDDSEGSQIDTSGDDESGSGRSVGTSQASSSEDEGSLVGAYMDLFGTTKLSPKSSKASKSESSAPVATFDSLAKLDCNVRARPHYEVEKFNQLVELRADEMACERPRYCQSSRTVGWDLNRRERIGTAQWGKDLKALLDWGAESRPYSECHKMGKSTSAGKVARVVGVVGDRGAAGGMSRDARERESTGGKVLTGAAFCWEGRQPMVAVVLLHAVQHWGLCELRPGSACALDEIEHQFAEAVARHSEDKEAVQYFLVTVAAMVACLGNIRPDSASADFLVNGKITLTSADSARKETHTGYFPNGYHTFKLLDSLMVTMEEIYGIWRDRLIHQVSQQVDTLLNHIRKAGGDSEWRSPTQVYEAAVWCQLCRCVEDYVLGFRAPQIFIKWILKDVVEAIDAQLCNALLLDGDCLLHHVGTLRYGIKSVEICVAELYTCFGNTGSIPSVGNSLKDCTNSNDHWFKFRFVRSALQFIKQLPSLANSIDLYKCGAYLKLSQDFSPLSELQLRRLTVLLEVIGEHSRSKLWVQKENIFNLGTFLVIPSSRRPFEPQQFECNVSLLDPIYVKVSSWKFSTLENAPSFSFINSTIK